MKPHEVISQEHILRHSKKRNRTTRFYMRIGTFEAVLWKKRYRPQRVYATDDQIQRARKHLIN